jgi:CHAT domain-containing protein
MLDLPHSQQFAVAGEVSHLAFLSTSMARRRFLEVFLGVAAIGAGALALILSHEPAGISALVTASAATTWRPVEGRLSGGFPYRAYFSGARGNVSAPTPPWSLHREAATIRDEAGKTPTPAMLHALGVAYLCTNQVAIAGQTLDRGLRLETHENDISRAIELSRDVPLLVDVAAGRLAQYSEQHDVALVLTALAAANRAVRLDGNSQEGAFNRALALENLGLRHDALDAWKTYGARNRTVGWEGEADRRAAILAAQTPRWSRESTILASLRLPDGVLGDSQRARVYVEDVLLPEWGTKVLASDPAGAAKSFTAAESIGLLIGRVTSDHMLEDEVASITRTSDKAGPARAHVAYGAAKKIFRTAPSDSSRLAFQRAALAFAKFDSPLAIRARMFAATVAEYSGRNSEALAETTALFASLGRNTSRYPSVAGELRWVAGLAAFTMGDYEAALNHYRTARAQFSISQDCGNLAGVAAATAECLRSIGYANESWGQILEAADLSAQYASRQRRYLVLAECTRLATENGYLGVARYFGDRMRAAAHNSGDAALECDALLVRAKLDETLRDSADALRMLGLAEQLSRSIPAPGVRDGIACRIAIARGAAFVTMDPRAAVTELSSAERLATVIELAAYGPEIHLLKSDAFRTMGQRDEMLAELRRGLAAFHGMEPTKNATDRATFAHVGRQLSDRLIESTIGHDEDSAWNAAMASLDLAPGQYKGGDNNSQALLAYHVLEGELLIWVVRGNHRALVRKHIPASTLNAALAALVSGVRHAQSPAASVSAGERGFDLLIRPVASLLTGVQRLWIVPDGAIEDVPFAILRERNSQRWLVELWPFSIVEPASTQERSTPYPTRLDSESLFVAAAPNVPSLQLLKGAEDEGHSVSELWGKAVLYSGLEATPTSFMEEAVRHGIVHFAGHITHHSDPAIAALRLSSQTVAGDGRVTGESLGKLSEHPPRLVVLSACGAAMGRRSALGALSLTRPLLNAGVPVVVASLWDVDDGATSRLMIRFYEELKLGRDPADALRLAQLRELGDHNPPRNSVVFQTYVTLQSI